MATSAPSPSAAPVDEYADFPLVEQKDEYADFPIVQQADDEYAAFPLVEQPKAVPPEVVAEEAMRATEGAKQALGVMQRIGAADWSEANEKMDAERFREAEALMTDVRGKISTPERRATFARANEILGQISPHTETGKYLAAQQAGKEQAAIEIESTQDRGTTMSGLLSSVMGPGLAPTVMPVIDEAGRGIGAAAGGAIGAARFIPHPGARAAAQLIGPMFGAIAGSQVGASGQESLLQATETPEETQARQERAAEDAARNPGLTKIGRAASSLPFFGPSLAQFSRAAAGDVGALRNILASGTIGAGTTAGLSKLQGQDIKFEDIAEAFFVNSVLNEPTKLGRRLGLKPSSEQEAVEAAAKYETGVPPIGRAPTSEVGTVAGMRRAPSESETIRDDADVLADIVEKMRERGEDTSIPALQTRLRIGSVRAANAIERLEARSAAVPERVVESPVTETPVVESPVTETPVPTETAPIPIRSSEAPAPKKNVRAASIRLKDGTVIDAPSHAFAYDKANELGLNLAGVEEGFTLPDGEFIHRDEAFRRFSGSTTEDLKVKPPVSDKVESEDIDLLKSLGIEPEAPPVAETPPPVIPPAEPPVAPATPEPAAPLPEGTSNKEVVVNAERAARALDPVIKEAALENPRMIAYAEDALVIDPERPQKIIDRLRAAPPEERTISMADASILLIERTKLRSQLDSAIAQVGKREGNSMERAIAQERLNQVEAQMQAMDQAAQDARSTWGRFGQLWQRSMREDFSLVNLKRRAAVAKGEALSPTEEAKVKVVADKAAKAHADFEIRQKQLALENRQNAIDAKIEEISAKAAQGTDPITKAITDKVIARLNAEAKATLKGDSRVMSFFQTQAEAARQRIIARRGKLQATIDPLNIAGLVDEAIIGAEYVAKGVKKFGEWSKQMLADFGERIKPQLKALYNRANELESEGYRQFLSDEQQNKIIDELGGPKKREVAAKIKAPKAPLDPTAQQARIEKAIAERIKEGKPLSSLAAYVNKLQELFIREGVTEREALIDTVHGTLQKHDAAITRDDAMEIMSKYGTDYATPLSKDPVKMTRRQVDGEIQQLLKLRDISAKVPIPKSGPERPTPGVTWRNLIKQVNAAKKKLGVVVTDPQTQLKSSQDAIRTRMRNDIEDMTLELETGERPPDKTPTEYEQDMQILKGIRDRVRETLDSIEGNKDLTDEQRLGMAKRSAEESLAMWERRLAGEQAKVRKGVTSPEIEAIKARRDAVKAQVEEIDAADAVLQENRKAEALVRQIEAVENQLSSTAARTTGLQGADTQLVAEAKMQLNALRNQLSLQRANDPMRQAAAIEKAEAAVEASIKRLDEQIQAGKLDPQAKKPGPQSDRLSYLRAQRDAMTKLRLTLRNEARPRLSADQLAIKTATASMLKRAADLRDRMAKGDFAPRTRKPPVDISGDTAALQAQADLMSVQPEFAKLQEQWKIDQLKWPQKILRGVGQAWDAGANMFLSFDLSTPIQTAFAMASRPIEGIKAIGKGAEAFRQQFFKGSEDYARREAARIANSINAKNGLYKAMKLELPSALGKAREENMSSVLEKLADLDAKWAGLPDVVKGLYKMSGKDLVKGGKRLAAVAPVFVGRGIKASNAAFETIANTMRARTADAMLARWYGPGRGKPTKEQLELIGEFVNIATGKGGLKAGDSIRRLLFAPNYYLSIMKQLSGWQLGKAAVRLEGKVVKDIATEYVRAVASMGAVYGAAMLFGNREDMEFDPRAKGFARAKTDEGSSIDITMGRGAWITAAAQIATGERINRGRVVEQDRKETALNFAGGRLSRGVATALTSAFGKDYKGKDIEGIEIAKDFVIPLSWRDFDEVLKKEGMTRGSFIQLLNILGVSHDIRE